MCINYMETYARGTSGLEGSSVVAAYDLMSLQIDRPGYEGEGREEGEEAGKDILEKTEVYQ